MFDIGFSELIVIGIVALVVVGPERLPKVARTAGLLLGRLRRYVDEVQADISREMQLDELKKLQADMQESARTFERSLSSEIQSAVLTELGGFPGVSWDNVDPTLKEKYKDVIPASIPVFPGGDWEKAINDGWYRNVAPNVDRTK